MKRIFILLSIAALSLASCDSYLDRQPDDALTSDTIWEKRNTTMQYLWNVYSWIPNDADPASNNDAFDACVSDETSGSFPNSRFGRYMFETQTPDDTFTSTKYRNMYYGIREAGIFMENVGRCPELTPAQIKEYTAEARFLRAYYYFYIMKNYGPTFFNGETSYEVLDKDVNEVDRTAWQPLVDWVCGQLDQAAADLDGADAHAGEVLHEHVAAMALAGIVLAVLPEPVEGGGGAAVSVGQVLALGVAAGMGGGPLFPVGAGMAEVDGDLQGAEHGHLLQVIVVGELLQAGSLDHGLVVLVQIVGVLAGAEVVDELQHAAGVAVKEFGADVHGDVVRCKGAVRRAGEQED